MVVVESTAKQRAMEKIGSSIETSGDRIQNALGIIFSLISKINEPSLPRYTPLYQNLQFVISSLSIMHCQLQQYQIVVVKAVASISTVKIAFSRCLIEITMSGNIRLMLLVDFILSTVNIQVLNLSDVHGTCY